MKLVYDEADPETQRAIKQVVLLLAAEMQPPREMDVLPAIDSGYAECRPFPEEGGVSRFSFDGQGIGSGGALARRLRPRRYAF